jgi:hypothetical protein
MTGFSTCRLAGIRLLALFQQVFVILMILLLAENRAESQVYVPIIVPQTPVLPVTAKADYSAIHSVAVISAIGEKLTLSYGNFLGNTSKDIPIQDWNIDALVETRLRQYLSSRFTFKDILYDRAALAKIPNTPFSFSNSQYADFLKTIPAGQADAYIIVRPDLEYKSPGVAGLGLVNFNNFGKPITPMVWANYEIDIVDARTLKTIAYAQSRLRLRDKTPATFAGIEDGALVSDGEFKLTDAQTNTLHANIVPLVNLSLIETLRDLGTGVDLPPPGARTLVPIPPDRDPYKAYKNVAVVSALGDMIDFEHEGGTIFSHDNYPTPEPDWQLDALVEARAKAALQKHFAIAEPNVDRSTFANAMMWDRDGKLAPNFAGLNPSPDVDLYVVFLKLNRPIWGVDKTAGVGVFNKAALSGETTTAFAHFAAVTIDAHTMKYIFASSGIMSPDNPDPDPRQSLDNSAWPKTPAAMSVDQAAVFRDVIIGLLNNSVDETLLHLALLGVVPTNNPPPPSASAQN